MDYERLRPPVPRRAGSAFGSAESPQIQVSEDHVDMEADGRLLCRYVHRSDAPATESPRPYLHPLRTLAGETVTGFRPADHPWHHGLSFTCANLSGHNFWGGPTYVRDRGYTQRDDHGRVEHVTWDGRSPGRLTERLRWTTANGATWIDERRDLAVAWVDDGRGDWALELGFELRNVAGEDLEFRSPTTEGRPEAGYGGLFWRGADSFVGGDVRAEAGLDGPRLMGKRGRWLAYTRRPDGGGRTSTVVFVDHPTNPRYPTQWFVRAEPYPGVAFAYAFDRPYRLQPDATLTLRHRVIVIDGDPGLTRIQEMAGRAFGLLEGS